MGRIVYATPMGKGVRVSKKFLLNRDGSVSKTKENPGGICSVKYYDYDGFLEFAEILKILSDENRGFLLRCELQDPAFEEKSIKRRSYSGKGTPPSDALVDRDQHWICLDIDGMPKPVDLDPRIDPETTIAHVLSTLPPYFHGVSCWWQFSSSQSLPGNENLIKVHLFFLLELPLQSKLLYAWAKSNQQKHHIDPEVFKPNQPIYISPPSFVNFPNNNRDVLAVRTGIYRGEKDTVSLDLYTPTTGSNVTPLDQKQTLRKHLAGIIGDGEGRLGFNAPIKSAIAAVIAKAGADIDRDALKADIRKFIEEAPSEDGRTGRPKHEYLADEYLDPLIDAIANKEDSARLSHQREYSLLLEQYMYVAQVGKFFSPRLQCYLAKDNITNCLAHVMRSAGDVFLTDEKFKRVDVVTYYPGMPEFCEDINPETGAKLSCYNVWRDVVLPEEPPSLAQPLINHIELICDHDSDVIKAVTEWMAYNVQFPGKKINYAVLIQGAQGTGKSALMEAMRAALGAGNVRMVEVHEIAGQFTSYLKFKSLICIEEIRDSHDRFGIYNRLKPLITAPTITLNEKGIPAYALPNRFNVLALTNYADAIPMDDDDRRFLVHFSQMKPCGKEYYDKLFHCINNYAGAIRTWLMSINLSEFNPAGRAPMTTSKKELLQQSGSPLKRWVKERIELEMWPFQHDLIVAQDLLEIVQEQVNRSLSMMALTMVMKEMGWVNIGQKRFGKLGKRTVWAIKNLEHWKNETEGKIISYYKRPIYDSLTKEVGYIPLLNTKDMEKF